MEGNAEAERLWGYKKRSTGRPPEQGYNLRDLKIGIARGFGLTLVGQGQYAGICERAVRKRNDTNGEFIEMVADFVRFFHQVREKELREILIAEIEPQLEKILPKAVRNVESAVDATRDADRSDEMARWVIEQLRPKTVNVHSSGRIDHLHAHMALPESTAARLTEALDRSLAYQQRAERLRSGVPKSEPAQLTD